MTIPKRAGNSTFSALLYYACYYRAPENSIPQWRAQVHKHNIWGMRQEEGYYTYNDLKPQQSLAAQNN